jgi:triacylglycerol lipase
MMSKMIRILIAVVFFSASVMYAESNYPVSSAVKDTPIIFVHGNGDDAAKWIGIIWLFESNGYPSDKLFSIRFTNPVARTDDTRDEPYHSSTIDAAAELSAFVTRVLLQTHSKQVALIGSSRGGLTIRNYLLHGGSGNVSHAILCGTPNHGVVTSDTNLNGEFNGKGHFLEDLNRPANDGSEVIQGVKMMTLRSDKLDKYAQPMAIAFGAPETPTGVGYDGPELRGADNVVLTGADHRELAFQPRAFAEMFKFITGEAPQTLSVTPEPKPTVSGLITGFENRVPTNQPLAGVHLRVYAVQDASAPETNPAYEATTASDGNWGPFQIAPDQEYDFDLEFQGRHVRYYKARIPRSTTLLNLRFLPVPKEQYSSSQTEGAEHIVISRSQGYFSRDRDPVMIDGKPTLDEPNGLPLNDFFVLSLPMSTRNDVRISLRSETVEVHPSNDFSKDLPIVDFLW